MSCKEITFHLLSNKAQGVRIGTLPLHRKALPNPCRQTGTFHWIHRYHYSSGFQRLEPFCPATLLLNFGQRDERDRIGWQCAAIFLYGNASFHSGLPGGYAYVHYTPLAKQRQVAAPLLKLGPIEMMVYREDFPFNIACLMRPAANQIGSFDCKERIFAKNRVKWSKLSGKVLRKLIRGNAHGFEDGTSTISRRLRTRCDFYLLHAAHDLRG